jgi:hypothetical protein
MYSLAGAAAGFLDGGSSRFSRCPLTQSPSMIPAITSVCRPQNLEPGTARREQERHASRDPTRAENAKHFFIRVIFNLRI